MTAIRMSATVVLAVLSIALAAEALGPVAPSRCCSLAANVSSPRQRSQAIVVEAVLKNIATVPVRIVETNPLADYRIILKDKRGIVLAYNKRTRSLIEGYNTTAFRVNLIELKPGEETKATFHLADMYDPIAPGQYTVEIERVGPISAGSRFIRPKGLISAPVALEVMR